ncbi:hypothetical protein GS966_25695 [Rhodococcus hoagii]|nr:hypothetical protein [Prescottella equi]NKS61658.1 hypothetical protein [Prescottella equi]NKZ93237.1 hypothetical protein [Prescottella equi]NKZ93297.1 hypothetical protein [Prescottella equi]
MNNYFAVDDVDWSDDSWKPPQYVDSPVDMHRNAARIFLPASAYEHVAEFGIYDPSVDRFQPGFDAPQAPGAVLRFSSEVPLAQWRRDHPGLFLAFDDEVLDALQIAWDLLAPYPHLMDLEGLEPHSLEDAFHPGETLEVPTFYFSNFFVHAGPNGLPASDAETITELLQPYDWSLLFGPTHMDPLLEVHDSEYSWGLHYRAGEAMEVEQWTEHR